MHWASKTRYSLNMRCISIWAVILGSDSKGIGSYFFMNLNPILCIALETRQTRDGLLALKPLKRTYADLPTVPLNLRDGVVIENPAKGIKDTDPLIGPLDRLDP
jgi:hypothetical protein